MPTKGKNKHINKVDQRAFNKICEQKLRNRYLAATCAIKIGTMQTERASKVFCIAKMHLPRESSRLPSLSADESLPIVEYGILTNASLLFQCSLNFAICFCFRLQFLFRLFCLIENSDICDIGRLVNAQNPLQMFGCIFYSTVLFH